MPDLAQQYLTALLNGASTTVGPAQVRAAIAALPQPGALKISVSESTITITSNLSDATIGSLTETLSNFNEGLFPGFPHCPD